MRDPGPPVRLRRPHGSHPGPQDRLQANVRAVYRRNTRDCCRIPGGCFEVIRGCPAGGRGRGTALHGREVRAPARGAGRSRDTAVVCTPGAHAGARPSAQQGPSTSRALMQRAGRSCVAGLGGARSDPEARAVCTAWSCAECEPGACAGARGAALRGGACHGAWRRPLGVAGVISAFNFPAAVLSSVQCGPGVEPRPAGVGAPGASVAGGNQIGDVRTAAPGEPGRPFVVDVCRGVRR